MRKDKKQIIGEEISDESIAVPRRRAGRRHPSLHKLIKAYRGLRIDDFERFLTFFREAGYDLDARDAKGNDFVALVADQRQAVPYIEALQAAKGA